MMLLPGRIMETSERQPIVVGVVVVVMSSSRVLQSICKAIVFLEPTDEHAVCVTLWVQKTRNEHTHTDVLKTAMEVCEMLIAG